MHRCRALLGGLDRRVKPINGACPFHIRSMHLPRFLVTPAELDQAFTWPNKTERPIPLSAAWFLPNDPEKRTGLQSFNKQRIPGSRFFDLDEIKDASSPWPHMLPDPRTFTKAMGELGIRKDDTVVVYDTAELGIFSAPRVAWTLKVLGHSKTHLLNNFRVWVDEGRAVESGQPARMSSASYDSEHSLSTNDSVVQFDEMRSIVLDKRDSMGQSAAPTLIDARPLQRWKGMAPEPRPNLPSGHMPGSVSVPFSDVLDPQTKCILPPSQLKELFKSKGVSADSEIISSCGTGVTAAVIDVALAEADWSQHNTRRIYDGSWIEWASRLRPEDGWIVNSDG